MRVEAHSGAAGSDITDRVQDFLKRHSIRDGFVVVTCLCPTAAVTVARGEPRILADLGETLRSLIKEGTAYRHEDPANPAYEGESAAPYLRGAFLGQTASVSVVRGRLMLAEHQRLILIELNGRASRAVHVQFLGV